VFIHSALLEITDFLFTFVRVAHQMKLSNILDNTTVDKLSPGSVAIASSISKVFASVMTYPHEVCMTSLSLNLYGWIIT